MKNKEYWHWLCHMEIISHRKIKALFMVFDNPSTIYNIEERQFRKFSPLSEKDTDFILKKRKELSERKRELELMERTGIRFLTVEDADYPKRLLDITDYPYGLYIKGSVPPEKGISAAIVGARDCTKYGREMTVLFAEALSRAGVAVISGMAHGIDGYAHRGALNAGMATYAVLGSGVDICYPAANRDIYERIPLTGGLLSEYPPGRQAKPYYFPMRNRIISGLADVVLIMEAREKSGSLITAELALEQGKDVYTLPGRVGDPLSVGCNRLIADGAFLLSTPDNLMEILGIHNKKNDKYSKNQNFTLDYTKKILYSCMSLVSVHVDDLVKQSGLERDEVINTLLEMELEGLIESVPGAYYNIRAGVRLKM